MKHYFSVDFRNTIEYLKTPSKESALNRGFIGPFTTYKEAEKAAKKWIADRKKELSKP